MLLTFVTWTANQYRFELDLVLIGWLIPCVRCPEHPTALNLWGHGRTNKRIFDTDRFADSVYTQ